MTSAEQSLTSENLSLEAKRYVSAGTLMADKVAVTSAQEAVTAATTALKGTTLVAPISGTVTAVGEAVGDSVSGSTTTSSSSGSSSTDSSSTASTSTASTSASTTTSSSTGTTVLVISQPRDLVVVADYPEADAADIAVGQSATVTLSALTGTSVPAKVSAVSSTATTTDNVVTYAETITLTDPPTTAKVGMSADVAVTTASRKDVLEIPTAAITTTGGESTVTVISGGHKKTVVVTIGLEGDSTTQIDKGVTAGEMLYEKSVSVSSTSSGSSNSSGSGSLGGTGTASRGTSTGGGFGGGANTGGSSTGGGPPSGGGAP